MVSPEGFFIIRKKLCLHISTLANFFTILIYIDRLVFYVKTLLMAGQLDAAFATAKINSVGWSYHNNAGVVFGAVLSFLAGYSEKANTFFDGVSDTFLKCSELARGFVDLLYLAPDHIHLYVESDGELSIEKFTHRIKRLSNDDILEKFPLIRDRLGGSTELWDEAYFTETID